MGLLAPFTLACAHALVSAADVRGLYSRGPARERYNFESYRTVTVGTIVLERIRLIPRLQRLMQSFRGAEACLTERIHRAAWQPSF